MKRVVIMSEADFVKLAVESTHIASDVSLGKDVTDNEKCMKEVLQSIGRHIKTIQAIIDNKEV